MKITEEKMNQAFNESGGLHHIYPYRSDYIYSKEIVETLSVPEILNHLYLDFAGHTPDTGKFDINTVCNILVRDGYCPKLVNEHNEGWLTVCTGITIEVFNKNRWLDIRIGHDNYRLYVFKIEKGTNEMVAEYLSALLESFDNIVNFVYKKHDIEHIRYKIAKVAQASGCSFLPEGMSCVVMPDEDGMYQVSLWHCGSIYEKVSVSENALADIKSILAGMHVKSGTLK